MAGERSAEQLRAIIRTQTEIAVSDLEPEAIMQLIADRAHGLVHNALDAASLSARL